MTAETVKPGERGQQPPSTGTFGDSRQTASKEPSKHSVSMLPSPGSSSDPWASRTQRTQQRLRDRLRLAKRRRSRKFTPDVALFWAASDFASILSSWTDDRPLVMDYDAWSAFFADAFEEDAFDPLALEQQESDVIAAAPDSPFARRLSTLRDLHRDWPFVVGNLRMSTKPEAEGVITQRSLRRPPGCVFIGFGSTLPGNSAGQVEH